MNLPIITISERDALRLRKLVAAGAATQTENIERLKAELERARIVPESELPRDVIAMNSTVELEDLEDGVLDPSEGTGPWIGEWEPGPSTEASVWRRVR